MLQLKLEITNPFRRISSKFQRTYDKVQCTNMINRFEFVRSVSFKSLPRTQFII